MLYNINVRKVLTPGDECVCEGCNCREQQVSMFLMV
jgi:hypothetical protein